MRALWPVRKQLHNMYMYIKCQLKPKTTCQPSGLMVKIGSRTHRLLIDMIKRNTEIVPLKSL